MKARAKTGEPDGDLSARELVSTDLLLLLRDVVRVRLTGAPSLENTMHKYEIMGYRKRKARTRVRRQMCEIKRSECEALLTAWPLYFQYTSIKFKVIHIYIHGSAINRISVVVFRNISFTNSKNTAGLQSFLRLPTNRVLLSTD